MRLVLEKAIAKATFVTNRILTEFYIVQNNLTSIYLRDKNYPLVNDFA